MDLKQVPELVHKKVVKVCWGGHGEGTKWYLDQS